MRAADRREFIPFVVELDGQEYEVHPGGRVYIRQRPHGRLRKVNELSDRFRTEESTLRRVKDKELVRRAREAAKGVEWAPGVTA